MGYITRRLTYQVATRRVSLPAQFLNAHGLEPGAELRIAAPSHSTRLVFTPGQWQALETTLRQLEAVPALQQLIDSGEPMTLGSLARVVLPRALAFEDAGERVELTWELEAGVLVVRNPGAIAPRAEPAKEPEPVEAATAPKSRQAVLPASPLPDGLVLPGPVVEVPLASIYRFDPEMEPETWDRDLAEDIVAQGILRPVVLSGPVPHRVIDGRRRLQVAQAIKLETVPAVVLGPLNRDDQARLRYLLETTTDRWNVARQLRVMARLHVNGASLEGLSRLLRKKKRTVQRYLRIAQDPRMIDAIGRGDLTLVEAERRAGQAATEREE